MLKKNCQHLMEQSTLSMEELKRQVGGWSKYEQFGLLRRDKKDLALLQFILYNKNMFEELDTVVLARDIEKYGLKRGDIGAVVHVYSNGKTVEVEFVTAKGKTVALVTLSSLDIRHMANDDILHVRGVATL